MQVLSRLLLVFSFGFLPVQCLAQQPQPKAEEKVYTTAEQMPEFPGGLDSLVMYLGRNIKYPEEAIRNNQEGTAYISFVVNSTGQIAEPFVEKSATPSLDKEVIRVIKTMPAWQGGRQNGVPTYALHVIPVSFILPSEDSGFEAGIQINEPFVLIETPPQYPGGDEALMRFLAKNLKYPLLAERNGVRGIVIISFTVTADGSLTNFKTVKALGSGTDKEAMRVLKLMPKWKPGTQNGKPVDVEYKLPIRFSLP